MSALATILGHVLARMLLQAAIAISHVAVHRTQLLNLLQMRNPKVIKQLSDRDEPADAALSTAIDLVGIAEDATSDIPVPGLGAAFSALDVLLHKIQDMKSNTQEAQDTIHNIESLRVVLESSTARILDQTRYIDDVQCRRMLRRESTSDELRGRIDKLSEELGTLGKLAEKLPRRRRWRRFFFTQQHAELLQRINRRVTEAKGRFQVQGGINIERILGEMCAQMQREEHDRMLKIHNDILEKLNPADASHRSSATDEKSHLHPETRKEILEDLHGWANDDDPKKRIYVLYGPAGIGKSSVVHAFSKAINNSQLGASFFFNHGIDGCRDPQRVIPTLAYQIAHHRPDAVQHIVDAVRKHLPGGRNQALEHQLRELLEAPLCRLSIPTASIILVLDGVDECSNDSGLVPILLELLCQAAHNIPSVRIIIVTRPETYIMNALGSVPFQEELSFCDLAQISADADISLYIGEHLHKKQLSAFLGARPQAVGELSALAGGLFVYAATVVRLLEQDPYYAEGIYDKLIASNGAISDASAKPDRLATLYGTILKNAFGRFFPDAFRMEGTCKVLAWITRSRHELSASKLADEGISVDMTRDVVTRLRSVLRIEGDPMDTKATFGPYHLSFTQFLLGTVRFTEPALPISKAVGTIAVESLNKILLECRTYLGPWDDLKSTVNVRFRPLRLLTQVRLGLQINKRAQSKCELVFSTGLSAEAWVVSICNDVEWSNQLKAELLSMAKARWTDWMLLCVQYMSGIPPYDVVSWDDWHFQWMIALEVWYMEHDNDGELSKIIEEAHAQAKREEERLTNRQSTWDINDRSSHYEGARRRLSRRRTNSMRTRGQWMAMT